MPPASEARNQVAAAIRSLVDRVGGDGGRERQDPREQGRAGKLVLILPEAERVVLFARHARLLLGETRTTLLLEAALTAEPLAFLLRGDHHRLGAQACPVVTA